MNRVEVSKISVIADGSVSSLLAEALTDLGVRESWTVGAKQLYVGEPRRFAALGSAPRIESGKAEITRFYTRPEDETTLMEAVAEAADLYLPGRGSVFAESAILIGNPPPSLAPSRASGTSPGTSGRAHGRVKEYSLIVCILQRGEGEALGGTMLEMGLCVPVVFYGKGMGLRNKLGLLRVTIPVDKELLWFLVPRGDADFVFDVAVRRARLDRPGRGFIYRSPVRALVVNSRMGSGKRKHLASMEQVIAALDEIRGSTEWRRIARKERPRTDSAESPLSSFSIICAEGAAEDVVKAAMEEGAGGATLVRMRREGESENEGRHGLASRARETCDLVVERALADRLEPVVEARGLFGSERIGFVERTCVERAVTYTH